MIFKQFLDFLTYLQVIRFFFMFLYSRFVLFNLPYFVILTIHQGENIKEGLKKPPTSDEGAQVPPGPTISSEQHQAGPVM